MAKKAAVDRLHSRARGGFSKDGWLKEGDLHLASSKMLRKTGSRRARSLSRYMEKLGVGRTENKKFMPLLTEREAAAKSSILLLGYAIELYLKAGLTAAYMGCSKHDFEHVLKQAFRHNLAKIAKEIEFKLSPKDRQLMNSMMKAVLSSARYPLMVRDEKEYTAEWNRLTTEFFSEERYKEAVALALRIRNHVSKLDRDEKNPASLKFFNIDDDGYFAFRLGGNLRPRITVRYSTEQRARGEDNKAALLKLIQSHAISPIIPYYWTKARFVPL